jgi:hypothetical protein
MAQTRDATNHHLTKRRYWEIARRDDMRVAQRLNRNQVACRWAQSPGLVGETSEPYTPIGEVGIVEGILHPFGVIVHCQEYRSMIGDYEP